MKKMNTIQILSVVNKIFTSGTCSKTQLSNRSSIVVGTITEGKAQENIFVCLTF